MSNTVGRGFAWILGVLAATQAVAHHGAGVFGPDKKMRVMGTVKGFQFLNPHVLVYIDVKGDDGKPVHWGGELTSPNRLARAAGTVKWHNGILKPGDQITITGHPARNGAPMMDILKIVDGQGTVLIDDE